MEDAITRLYNVTEEAEDRYVMAIFVDIQSAFDSTHGRIRERLSLQFVPYN